jgi:lipoprotein-anchoring transpeptidase ErfK/SrfK
MISLALAATIGFALSAGTAEANHKKNQTRQQCGFFGCKSQTANLSVKKVRWQGAHRYTPGSIVVHTDQRSLYYIVSGDTAIRYPVGVGREGFQWSGSARISAKKKWPGWTPPDEMIMREARKGRILPSYMPGGPNNPLGARALYIGSSLYRIHGTNDPSTIGRAISSGCIRMMNEHVTDLYNRVSIGAKVYVYQ